MDHHQHVNAICWKHTQIKVQEFCVHVYRLVLIDRTKSRPLFFLLEKLFNLEKEEKTIVTSI